MPPKSNRPFQRTLSNSSNASSSSTSSKSTKLKQNKLDFSFHSTSSASAARPFGSRPLSSTPSFGLPSLPPPRPPPTAPSADKGKQRQQESVNDRSGKLNEQIESSYNDADSLWSERLAPHTGDELALHPKKVAQVRTWLEGAFSNKVAVAKYRKVLALTGPAGAGKSATVRALASNQDLDFDILEWHNDQPSFDPDNPGISFIERFTDFLSKAAKFPTLDLQASGDDDASNSSLTLESAASTNRRRVILLEDLPNLHHLPTKQFFQVSIEQHIQQSIQLTARGFPNVPIVIVVTESTPREDQDRWAGDSSSGNTWRERIASIMDTRTALGENIRKHPAYTEVRFNPVAPTIVLKGLKRAIERASSSTSKTTSKVWLQLLQAIAEDSNGDLRAAVNCLQFVGANSKHLETIAKQRGATKGQDLGKAMRKMMPLVSGRESSLALFHALGKVLYNKREGDPGDEGTNGRDTANSDTESDQDIDGDGDGQQDSSQLKQRLKRAMQSIVQSPSNQDSLCNLPEHLSFLDRRPSRVAPDQLWADLPVDPSVFQLYLHQNLPQFCTEVEQCESILEFFSTADVLMPLHEQYRHSSLSAYYAFLLSTRGTLLHLPSPVPRSGQKLGKATWWDVQKKLRVVLQDVEDVKAASSGSAGGAGKVEREDAAGGRFKRTKFSHPAFASDDTAVERTDAGLGDEAVHTTLLRSDPVTLVTEVLPLLAKIRPSGLDGRVNELARMRFEYAGVADMASRILDEHETGVVGEEDDDAPSDHKQQQARTKSKPQQREQREEEREEKLILSDDDIGDF
ncbi:related to cell cycle checkpoint protein RAD17 [Sporisorium reilianum f. sp. reilianum]|uniref:Related to cell cycle checkpoint protein RAD17 n=1 Tax=Sporisorium reilianum f. sp. reilianum TaxID=72559 RepID=A0A2N8U9G0_9BASI|nr:related to cell cycle checkpoint protein RAD17 [Sporisorium reilianum f. sp. reilianum]